MMKKRIILVCLCFAIALVLAACSGTKLSKLAPEDPLITIDGEVVMTVQDFLYLKTEQTLQKEYFDADAVSEKELFALWAERYILAYFSRHYAENEVTEGTVESDFDGQLAEMEENPTEYESQLAFIEAYKKQTGMTAEKYRSWSVDVTMIQYEVDALLVDITDSFPAVTDPTVLEEHLIETIFLLVDDQDVAIFYPGLIIESLTFRKGIA